MGYGLCTSMHCSLELGMSLRRSYFFIIWRYDLFNVSGNRVRAVTACHPLRSRAGLQGFRSEIGYGKSLILVWNRVRVSESVPHTPTQFFWKYPRGFSSYFIYKWGGGGGHCASRSLWRPWKLGLRIVAWSKPRMFRKDWIWSFPETCRSTNSIAWKCWLLWNKWTLLSSRGKK